jgi:hypothetical protein
MLLLGGSGKIQFKLIDEAPSPILATLNGTHDGMLGFVEMFGSVFVLRGIAATDFPALHAKAQMDPAVASFHALLAALCMRLDVLDLIEMRTLCHKLPPLGCCSGSLIRKQVFPGMDSTDISP